MVHAEQCNCIEQSLTGEPTAFRKKPGFRLVLVYGAGDGGAFMCRPGYYPVRCTGEAHTNPHIDNCMMCAPMWGWHPMADAAELIALKQAKAEKERRAMRRFLQGALGKRKFI